MVAKLESLNPDNGDLLKQFRAIVVGRMNAKQEDKELNHTPIWISEAEALAIFKQSWSQKPTIRPLREYFSSRKALTRSGKHGMVYYDGIIVRELADKYEPISDHIDKLSRAISGILAGFDSISIGCIKLIKREQMGTFLRAIGNRARKPARLNTSKTYPTLLAKQEPAQTVQEMEYVANA